MMPLDTNWPRKPVRAWLYTALLFLLLAAASCQPAATIEPIITITTEPTTTPSPTTEPSVTPTQGFQPLTEATQPIVLEPPEPTLTPSPAPPPVNLPDSSITLYLPGPGSQVTSPIRVLGHGGPSFQERVEVRLFNEQGEVLNSLTTILFAYPGNAGRFAANIPFEIPAVSELGWIQVDTFDRRYGRLAHRYTREMVLLSTGSPRIYPGHPGPAQLAILQPRHDAIIPFGQVQLFGGGWSEGEGELLVQAWDRSGEVIDSQPIELTSGDSGRIGTFEAALTIDLPFSQFGRLAVMELDPRGGQPKFLNSFEVYFSRN